jgi:hypothetical protein
MLRSVLVAAFSAVVAFGALSGFKHANGDARANSVWPAATTYDVRANSVWPAVTVDGTGTNTSAGGAGS